MSPDEEFNSHLNYPSALNPMKNLCKRTDPQPLATEMKDNTVIFIEGEFNFIIQSLTSIYSLFKKDLE